jgi:hypothetical protein
VDTDRFQSMSLLGAKAVVARSSSSSKHEGKCGIITAVSRKAYFVSCTSASTVRVKSDAQDSRSSKVTPSAPEEPSSAVQSQLEGMPVDSKQSKAYTPSNYEVKSAPLGGIDNERVRAAKVQVIRIDKEHAALSILLPTAVDAATTWSNMVLSTAVGPTPVANFWQNDAVPQLSASQLDGMVACINHVDTDVYGQVCMLYGEEQDPYSYLAATTSSKKLKAK